MHEALSNRRTETAQEHTAATQKSRRVKTPLQRSHASAPLLASVPWGNHVPPWLRLSTGSPIPDEQPKQFQEKQHDLVEDEERTPVQRTSLPSLQSWNNQVPLSQRLSAPKQAKQVQEASQKDTASASRQENTTGLPDNLKAGVEGLSGISLNDVHVHYNSSKPAEVQALAYTKGTEIHVGPGQEQHLTHEVWHVVQQKQERVSPTMQMKGMAINDDEGLEREADVMGTRVPQMMSAGLIQQGKMQPLVQNNFNTKTLKSRTESSIVIQMNGKWGRRKNDYSDLESEDGLAAFQKQNGGSSEGTLVFVKAGTKYYMTEQQTNNRISQAASERNITYIPQGRQGGFHAEMRFVAYALEEEITLSDAEIWVSKPICQDCQDVLETEDVTIMTSTSGLRYHNWISPDVGHTRVQSTGRFIGRRSEAERLRAALPANW